MRLVVILLTSCFLIGGNVKGQEVYLEKKIEQDSFVIYLSNESYMPLYVEVRVNENIPADSRVFSDFILPAKSDSEKVIVIPIFILWFANLLPKDQLLFLFVSKNTWI
jgi:hypothetical protein